MKKGVLLLTLVSLLLFSTLVALPIVPKTTAESKTVPILRMGSSDYWTYPTLPNTTLNPLEEPGASLYLPIYGRLYRLDENGSPIPWLASSANVINDTTWEINLVDNATHHNGHPFNSTDVKYTMDMILTDNSTNDYWTDYLDLVSIIDSVTVVDAYKIQMRTKIPFPGLMDYLALIPIMPAEGWSESKPIGTGPFKVDSWQPGIKNITMSPYDGYFLGEPRTAINYAWDKTYSELNSKLISNEIDLVPTIDPNEMSSLEIVTAVSPLVDEALTVWMYWPNLNNPYLADKNVLQAITYATDRASIIQSDFNNYASLAKSPIPPSVTQWHNPSVKTYDHNPKLANDILDNAGYIVKPNGWRFSLAIKCNSEKPKSVSIANKIANDLKVVGINASVIPLPKDDYEIDIWTRNFDIFVDRITWENTDPSLLATFWHSNSSFNFFNYSNPEMDARLDELGSTFKTTRRRELCYEIQTILSDELPIFLVHDMKMVGVNNDFYNFKLTPHLSITGDSYCLESVEYDKTVSAEVNSPYGVSFTDNLGRRTGYFNESVYEDIPKSTYTGIDSDPQIIRIRSPEGNFSCQVFPKEGAGYVSFSVELCFISDTFKDPKILNGAVSNDVVYEYSDYHGRDRIDIRKDVIFYECDFRVDPDGSIFIYDSWHIPDSTLLFSALIYDEHRYGLTYEIALVIFCQNPRMRPGRWIIDIS